jgi:fructose-1,6-bisphosphatase/inositol monophosphatase family enzyme
VSLSDDSLVELLHETAVAVRSALDSTADWGLAGTRAGQYRSDLAADDAALAVLERAGVGVLSEESGTHRLGAGFAGTGFPGVDDGAGAAAAVAAAAGDGVVVVVDPLDGSTNASRGIPWYAVSLCAVDAEGPRAALVVDLPHGRTFSAVRGGGARADGLVLQPSGLTDLSQAVVGLAGFPPRPLGWRQFRALGACALDLCAVAEGTLDAYVDCSPSAHGVWDYLGGMLVCTEAGVPIGDALGRDLVVVDPAVRRAPVAAATPELYAALLDARRTFGAP